MTSLDLRGYSLALKAPVPFGEFVMMMWTREIDKQRRMSLALPGSLQLAQAYALAQCSGLELARNCSTI